MPFNKRKQEKQSQAKEGHLQEEQAYEAAIQKAAEIEDPAQKVLALRKVELEINARLMTESKEIGKTADKKIGQSALVGLAPAAAGGAAVGLFAGPLAIFAVPAGAVVWAGAALVGAKRAETTEKKLRKAAESHRDHITEQANRAYKMADAVIEDNVEEIYNSPLFKQVKALPGNTAKIAAVVADHIAAQKKPEAEETPQAALPSRKLRLIKPGKQP